MSNLFRLPVSVLLASGLWLCASLSGQTPSSSQPAQDTSQQQQKPADNTDSTAGPATDNGPIV
ncbi:MAG: hypothetical protein FWD64_12890, partial [Acidobacteriaceae bacterium]|nr:hypothetical protein [Acidobacteriaceae bacterium]